MQYEHVSQDLCQGKPEEIQRKSRESAKLSLMSVLAEPTRLWESSRSQQSTSLSNSGRSRQGW